MKSILALGTIAVFGFLGYRISDPLYDAAARSICSEHAEDQGLVDARGAQTGRLAFRAFPDYSCEFRDPVGATVSVDENDGLIEGTWTYRALRAAGWLSWVAGIVLGVGISVALGLLKRE